jgi:hypothetical protein
MTPSRQSLLRALERGLLLLAALLTRGAQALVRVWRSPDDRAQPTRPPRDGSREPSVPPLFTPRADVVMRAALLVVGTLVVATPILLITGARLPEFTGAQRRPAQPMWFDHRHHVAGFRIDCRYCHSTVERSATASVPSTATCVPCHSPGWLNGPHFAPVRRSLTTGMPIPWRRVHDLPDHVYFNHAIHVRKGVGCETCHGRIDRMELVEQAAPLTMRWCLDCHQAPERFLRPVEEITTMGWQPEKSQLEVGRELKERYAVRELTDCTSCHR